MKAVINVFNGGVGMPNALLFSDVKDESISTDSSRPEIVTRYMIMGWIREYVCANARYVIQKYLGVELDLMEFVYTRYGRNVAAKSEHHPVSWRSVSRIAAAEPDVLRAIAGGAQAALDIRFDYSCRELLHDILLGCDWKLEIWETWCSITEREDMYEDWRRADDNLWSKSDGHRILDHIRIVSEKEHTDSTSMLENPEHDSTEAIVSMSQYRAQHTNTLTLTGQDIVTA